MNRFTPGVPAILILSAWSFAALADGASPAAAPAAAQGTSTATASPAAAQQAKPSATPAAPGNNASVQRLVCLNMSLQCFSMKPKSEEDAARTRTASLDLKAPDIRSLVPEVQLRESLMEDEVEVQQVQVEGTRPEVYVPGGIASLPWAVMHPTQAWRIFLPVPPGTAK